MKAIKNDTRFLLTLEKPCEGETCRGKETLTNGQTETVKTSVVEQLTELISGKYYMKTSDGDYLVDVVCQL